MNKSPELNACGCCEVSTPPTPEKIWNRPGLSSIRYRVGTYATFHQAMIEAISGAPELSGWTARTSDDYGIAILEMWAYLADILTFYQERIANEAFLRTAIFPESVRRLAALLDYKPAPGLAAMVDLAFTVEKDKQVKIPVGLKVQSVPGQDEKPQKFETMEEITAEAKLNSIKIYPIPSDYKPLAADCDTATVTSDISHISPGDKLVIFEETSSTPFMHVEEKKVKELRTRDWRKELVWEPKIRRGFDNEDNRHVRKWVRKFRLFGHNAPSEYITPTTKGKGKVTWNVVLAQYDHKGSVYDCGDGKIGLDLDAVYDDLKESVELLVVSSGVDKQNSVVKVIEVIGVQEVEAKVKGTVGGTNPSTSEMVTAAKHVDVGDREEYQHADRRYEKYPDPTDQAQQAVSTNHEIALPWSQAAVSRVIIESSGPELLDLDSRYTVIYELEGEKLSLWDKKYEEYISGSAVFVPLSTLGIDADQAPSFVEPSRRLLLEGNKCLVRATTSAECDTKDDHLKIPLNPPIPATRCLATENAVLYGNVAKASHGETAANEVMGSGDASSSFQSFPIKKLPVTFLPDPNAYSSAAYSGAASSLEVRVDGVLWKEVRSLYGHKGDERIYTTNVDDEGVMTAQFGDGVTGARLPSGRNNVIANYRQGLGRDGKVFENALKTLLDRPLGLKGVTNPDKANGGVDPESLDKIRTNTPNTVRTFDRIVSLRDFEYAALEYQGIAKALATWIWDGEEQVVFLTVAGDEGGEVDDEVKGRFIDHLDARRDSNRKIWIESFREVPIEIDARIHKDEAYLDEDVEANARLALEDYFSFDNLKLGQYINLSDVFSVIQNAEGVVGVYINYFQYKNTDDRSLHGIKDDPVQLHLPIFGAHLLDTDPPLNLQPAELAKLSSAKLDVGVLQL